MKDSKYYKTIVDKVKHCSCCCNWPEGLESIVRNADLYHPTKEVLDCFEDYKAKIDIKYRKLREIRLAVSKDLKAAKMFKKSLDIDQFHYAEGTMYCLEEAWDESRRGELYYKEIIEDILEYFDYIKETKNEFS